MMSSLISTRHFSTPKLPHSRAMLSCVQMFVTPWTVAPQAPLSTGFFRQNTGVGCCPLLQGIFLTQGSNPRLLFSRWLLYHQGHLGSPLHS